MTSDPRCHTLHRRNRPTVLQSHHQTLRRRWTSWIAAVWRQAYLVADSLNNLSMTDKALYLVFLSRLM